jgi:hypothetical protein
MPHRVPRSAASHRSASDCAVRIARTPFTRVPSSLTRAMSDSSHLPTPGARLVVPVIAAAAPSRATPRAPPSALLPPAHPPTSSAAGCALSRYSARATPCTTLPLYTRPPPSSHRYSKYRVSSRWLERVFETMTSPLYRLASLRGVGARLGDVSETATRGCLETAKISGTCLLFLMHLVRQHVLTLPGGAAGADAAAARLVAELGITVGKPMPELQKHVNDKWRPFDEVRKRVQYKKIAVEDQGKKLGNFNRGRESKVSNDSLRTAEVITADLRALLMYLGHEAGVGSPKPSLMKETAAGWVPLKESARLGDHMVAIAGTGEGEQGANGTSRGQGAQTQCKS